MKKVNRVFYYKCRGGDFVVIFIDEISYNPCWRKCYDSIERPPDKWNSCNPLRYLDKSDSTISQRDIDYLNRSMLRSGAEGTFERVFKSEMESIFARKIYS